MAMEEQKQHKEEEDEKQHEEEEEEKVKTAEMTPWEQHSAVISIPRYDYNAPSSLLQYPHSGFLITCPIKREKSATKEAITIISKNVGSLSTCSSGSLEDRDTEVDHKRRKIFTEEIGQGCDNDGKSKDINDSGEVSKETASSSSKIEANLEEEALSLVKLNRSGLVLFTYPKHSTSNTTNTVSNIFHALDSGNQKPLNWCHRIFPIQATCRLNEENLREVVTKLVKQFLDNKQNKLERTVKFAVAYNRRGMDEAELKIHKSNSKDSNLSSLLDRNQCFGIVASGVKGVIADAVVDLKSPEFAVLIEVLPLTGAPNGSVVAAVSVLSHDLINTKPKLSIKALISNIKK